jgi:hypothetical protein
LAAIIVKLLTQLSLDLSMRRQDFIDASIWFYVINLFSLFLISRSILRDVSEQRSSNVFFYIQSNEGLIAHLRELATLSDITSIYAKRIIALPFMSKHYADIGSASINICEIFVLPSTITCANISISKLLADNTCYYSGYHKLPYELAKYKQSSRLVQSRSFRYRDASCFIGGLNYSVGVYDENKLIKQPLGIRIFTIQEKYLKLHDQIKELLSLTDKFIVIHWRRGDQLTTRCDSNKASSLHYDTSVNCEDARKFLMRSTENLRLFVKDYHSYSIYVATNEEDEESLSTIETSTTFRLFKSIKEKVTKLIELNSINAFMIDLVLMCHANYYMAWGQSSIHRYVAGYRQLLGKKNQTFIYENSLGYDIYT